MELTPALAEKYVRYRSRYLYGTGGIYLPNATLPDCHLIPGIEIQKTNAPVGFLSDFGYPTAHPGTFLNADILNTSDASAPTTATIVNISNGDNIIYGSYAAMNFAAEYAITLDQEPLQICLNIVQALQRLGTYQAGLNDPSPGGYHGFMLRADSPVDGELDQNICVWAQNPENAKNLEPSYDQYCALLSTLRIIQLILANVPPVAGHAALRTALEAAIVERVGNCVSFLAGTFWTILWINQGGNPRVSSRGPFCIQASYPFAKIAALVLAKSVNDFFTEPFPLSAIAGFAGTSDLDAFSGAIRANFTGQIGAAVSAHILDSLVLFIKSSVIGTALDEVVKFWGGEDKVDDTILGVLGGITVVTDWITNRTADFIQQITAWAGVGAGLAAAPFAQFIHRYYSIYMLQDFQAAFSMSIGDILGLVGIAIPSDPHFDFDFNFTFSVASAPSWWPAMWSWNGWSKPFNQHVSYTIPLGPLWNIPIPIGLLDPLALILAGVGSNVHNKPDLRMLLFLSNVAADTFLENGIDPVDASVRFQNSFMMALTYRAYPALFQGGGSAANLLAFTNSMELLAGAPDTFPEGRGQASPWNQNFRWMRDISPGDAPSPSIYTGMDFMLPLMLAASTPDDVVNNRAVLTNALSPIYDQEQPMGLFQLPFQGGYGGRQKVLTPKAGGTQTSTVVYLGVVFNRKGGTGTVTVYYTDLAGNAQSESFDPNLPSKMIAIPLNNTDIEAEILTDLKGYFLVEVAN